MPPVHPLFVHFPIGILVLTFLLEALSLIMKREEFSRFGWWTQLAGSLGILFAISTGLLAERNAGIAPPALETFERHEQLAFLTSSLFALLLLWRIAARGKVPSNARRLYVFLLAIGLGALLATAWLGGELVFRFGTGIMRP